MEEDNGEILVSEPKFFIHASGLTIVEAIKVVYLAMRNIAKKWTMPIHDWKPALNRFAVEFAERFPR